MDNKRNGNKKYVMIVTSEDDRYNPNAPYDGVGVQLGFFADNPCEGRFECCIDGDSFGELCEEMERTDVGGLFYQLYENKYGNRISYGTIDYDAIQDEIDEYEIKNVDDIDASSYDVQYRDEILLKAYNLEYAKMCKKYFQEKILNGAFDEKWSIRPEERRVVADEIVIIPVN